MVDIYDMLVKAGAIKHGKFKLTSGKISDFYVDIKEAVTDPKILTIITEQFSQLVGKEFSCIVGMELGAVPLIVALSLKLDIPYVIVRKEKREHGITDRFVGKLKEGHVLVVDDVITTGKSVAETVQLLKEIKVSVDRVIAVVDRNEGGNELLSNMNIKMDSLVKLRIDQHVGT
ncbi:MAG: orotate phosphoribosyltransferase [Candidatus Thermoplasmatota archaeon]|jgi:orotate phosphoribosyltransferase|nr:orotate phosphoribosyltransferase [Candidatus Thermoplasmatota archaeon]MCL5964053.1 orotate phosphoribosyltransferase [Candidatus Thermoplasmatota archaeon]